MIPNAIIDAHHHLWSLQGDIKYPWLQEAYDAKKFILGDYKSLCQDFDVNAFQEIIGDVPVVATVHVEAECSRTDALQETKWLHEIALTHQADKVQIPAAIVAWVDLLADDAEERLTEHLVYPLVRGIRFKPRTSESPNHSVEGLYTLTDSRWFKALKLLNKYNLVWDLRVPFWHLSEAAALLKNNSSLNVVLEHTGLPWDRTESGLSLWRKGMMELAGLPNVTVKLSEFGVKDAVWNELENRRIIKETIEIFTPQRCMFASNFPVAGLRVSYAQLVNTVEAALQESKLNTTDCRAIWWDTANRVYKLNLTNIFS